MKRSSLDTYQPPPQQQKQITYLFDLLEKSRANNIVVWVLGGYGLDALYGKLTRDHRDFDLHIYKKDKNAFIKILESLKYYPTGETVGVISKEVYKHRALSPNFSLEFAMVEKDKELMKRLGIELLIPDKPLGILHNHVIWTPALETFKVIIDINNKLTEKINRGKYPHSKWQHTMLAALEKKRFH